MQVKALNTCPVNLPLPWFNLPTCRGTAHIPCKAKFLNPCSLTCPLTCPLIWPNQCPDNLHHTCRPCLDKSSPHMTGQPSPGSFSVTSPGPMGQIQRPASMTSPMLPATSPLPSPSPMYPPSNSPHPSQSPQPSMSPSPAGHHGYASQSPHPHLPSPRMHDDNPFSPNSMQRPPHTTSPAMSPASSHMSPVHCMFRELAAICLQQVICFLTIDKDPRNQTWCA